MKVAVLGGGYVGLVTAAGLVHLGHHVDLVEIDREKLSALANGVVPIYEPGLAELIEAGSSAGALRFTAELPTALVDANVAMIAVNTPSNEDGSVDTTYVDAAIQEVLRFGSEDLVLAVKSTVPVGTVDSAAEAANGNGSGREIRIVSNPEFLREGSAVGDFLRPDRIVIGGDDDESIEIVARLYESIDAPVLKVSRRAAELAKYAANAYLATRISFMNDLSRLCDATVVDVFEVEEILGTDRRIGPHFLKAGLGWGGSCFPKDVSGLITTAETLGIDMRLVRTAKDVNDTQIELALIRVLEGLDRSEKPTIAVLGLSFKPHTDDIRESPALRLIDRLADAGARVRAYDPVAIERARKSHSTIEYSDDPYAAVAGADVVVLATEWPQFRELDWARVAAMMTGRRMLDGRNLLDPSLMRGLGFDYQSFGRTTGSGRAQAITFRESESPR